MARFDLNGADFAEMAASGNADVLFELGLIYATGREGEKDVIAAHKWFNLAAYRGNREAGARRDEIADEMDKGQIATALRAARDWIKKH